MVLSSGAHCLPLCRWQPVIPSSCSICCVLPCFAAIGAIKREMNNGKWTLFAVAYQDYFCLLAFSLCIYQFGSLLTGGSFGIWTIVAAVVLIGFLYLLVRPDPAKKSVKEASRSAVAAD